MAVYTDAEALENWVCPTDGEPLSAYELQTGMNGRGARYRHQDGVEHDAPFPERDSACFCACHESPEEA